MVEFSQLVISAILIGMFTFSLIISGVIMQGDNNITESILQDPANNKTFNDLRANLSSQQGISQTQLEGFDTEAPEIGTNVFLFSSIVKAVKTLTSSLNLLYNVVFNLILVKLGLGSGAGLVLFGGLLAILLVTILFLAYKVFKIGT